MTAALQDRLHTSPQPTSSSVSPASSGATSLFNSLLLLLRLFKQPHPITHFCHSCGSMKPSSTSPHLPQLSPPDRLKNQAMLIFMRASDDRTCTLHESPMRKIASDIVFLFLAAFVEYSVSGRMMLLLVLWLTTSHKALSVLPRIKEMQTMLCGSWMATMAG